MTELFEDSHNIGIIEPIDLLEERVIGQQLVGILLLGIFNPMGPTLTPISLLRDDDSEIAYLLLTSLNPFNQSRQLVARVYDAPESIEEYLPQIATHHPEGLPQTLPTLLLCPSNEEAVRSFVMPAAKGLVESLPLTEPLSETIEAYQNHPGDPWGRIPSFEEMMASGQSGQTKEIPAPTEEERSTWYEIMCDPNHGVSEFQAIIHAWSGAIQNFGPGLPHMPMEEAAAELTALGFPFFSR